MLIKALKFFLSALVALLLSTNSYAQEHYVNLGFGNTILNSDTYDYVETKYPYNFTRDAISFHGEVGRHINEKFDIGLKFISTDKFSHDYSGPVETDIDPTVQGKEGDVHTSQNIKSTMLLLQGKYKYSPSIFSKDSYIYARTGFGFAFNHSSDYLRNIMDTIYVSYPGNTETNLGLSIGAGVAKKLDNITLNLGYDCYSIGSFQTQNKVIINDLSTNTVTVYGGVNDIIGKRLRPKNILLHTLSISIGFSF